MSYSKLTAKASTKVSAPKISLGSSSSSSSSTPPSPLNSLKKNYSKNKSASDQFGNISFGNTGLTGES